MATVTKPIVLNETYSEKMEALISALSGVSKGAATVRALDVSEGKVEICANVVNVFPELAGAIDISFAPADSGLDNEWVFVITQGETVQTVTLPSIDWYLGIAPSFETGSVTEMRVHTSGDKYKGVWTA